MTYFRLLRSTRLTVTLEDARVAASRASAAAALASFLAASLAARFWASTERVDMEAFRASNKRKSKSESKLRIGDLDKFFGAGLVERRSEFTKYTASHTTVSVVDSDSMLRLLEKIAGERLCSYLVNITVRAYLCDFSPAILHISLLCHQTRNTKIPGRAHQPMALSLSVQQTQEAVIE